MAKRIAKVEAPPTRPAVIRSPAEWYGRLKEELIMIGIEHDHASLVARRVLSAFVPTHARLNATDRS
jgi:hypothetical protein